MPFKSTFGIKFSKESNAFAVQNSPEHFRFVIRHNLLKCCIY